MIWIPVFIYHFFKSQILAGGIGITSTEFLVSLLGNIGTTLLLITTFLIFITLKFNISLEKIFLFIKNSTSNIGEIKLQNIEEIEVDNIIDLQESETTKIENLKVKKAVLPTEINQKEDNLPKYLKLKMI